jgi:hypothetical protein
MPAVPEPLRPAAVADPPLLPVIGEVLFWPAAADAPAVVPVAPPLPARFIIADFAPHAHTQTSAAIAVEQACET